MIGIFDSGSGGLSVVGAIYRTMPKAEIVYFGDIAHAPYGVRAPEDLRALTKAGVAVLKRFGATAILSACNSVSPSILAGAAGEMPAIEMSRPAALGMRAYTGKRVLLIATPATVSSRIYENSLGGFLKLESLPIRELAGAIEFGASEAEIVSIVRAAFQPLAGADYDALFLGCTHYPLVSDIIEREARSAFGDVAVIDPATFVAEEARKQFNMDGSGIARFYISKDSDMFRGRVHELFHVSQYTIEVI